MDKRGWVKIYRELMYKPIWTQTTPEQKVIHRGKLYNCKPGQFITSLESLAAECGKGVTIQNIRTAIKLFENLGFLTNQSTKSGRLITVVNWGKYQLEDDEPTDKLTKSQQRANKEPTNSLTTNKEIKNDKNEKKGSIALRPEHKEIIDYFNEKAGTKYMHTSKSTQTAINARLNDRFSVNDFKAVIDIKVKKWLNDPKMRDYLRPETLFAASHFESYLNEAIAEKPQAQRSSLSERLMNETTAEETDANINNHSSDNYPFK